MFLFLPLCSRRRRLVRPLLLSLLASKLQPGGLLRVATDVEGYSEHTKREVARYNSLSPKPPTFNKEREEQEEQEREEVLSLSSVSSSSSSVLRPPQAAAPARTPAVAEDEVGLDVFEERITSRRADQTPQHVCGQQQQQQAGGDGQSRSRLCSGGFFARWEGGETAHRPMSRPLTKYEEKAKGAGRRVRDFRYRLELE